MPALNPDALKIGYVVLVAGSKFSIRKLQQKAGRRESAQWTHVAGCLGGLDAIEAVMPQSRVINMR